MTSSNQLAVSLVEFGNASPALLQRLLEHMFSSVIYQKTFLYIINTRIYYMYDPNMYLLKRFILSLAKERAVENWHKGVSM